MHVKPAQPAKPIEIPGAHLCRRQVGRVFSENAITVDIRQNVVKRSGVKAALKIDEIIGLGKGRNKVHFRVKSTGKPTLGSRG